MRHDFYLVFAKTGIKRSTRGIPDLRSGEFAVRIVLEIPTSVFKNEPPMVVIAVPERAIVKPTVTVEAAPSRPAPGEGEVTE